MNPKGSEVSDYLFEERKVFEMENFEQVFGSVLMNMDVRMSDLRRDARIGLTFGTFLVATRKVLVQSASAWDENIFI